MAKVKVLLPAMGEGVIEATITQWLKQVGDTVEEDDPIVEIATDKVDSEIPSPAAGKLSRQLFSENDVPKVGDLIAVIETESTEGVDPALILTDEAESAPPSAREDTHEEDTGIATTEDNSSDEFDENVAEDKPDFFLSPLVRCIAEKENISQQQLSAIKGTGLNDRITKNDILAWINANESQASSTQGQSTPQSAPNTISQEQKIPEVQIHSLPGDEITEMGRMRKLIANHMVASKRTSPHVTSFVEVDVTPIVNWRNAHKESFLEKYGEKLTYTPIFMEAVVKTIADFPLINVSVGEGKIIVHKQVNIGMAAALPSGDLIVPVIKQANEKNLLGLARSVNDLAKRARINKLKPDEIKGGTFTVTNVGTFNNITGTPIINQPEVAVLALGAIKKKPAVIETPSGDTIGIRHIMILSMAYDHRVVDGALGGMFLSRVGQYLEEFDENRVL
ncbi:MAG: dihydrolipoamide acetyltransferase family protein [Salinivirgaceae bacterium]|jgi:2-oxoglutarate dehydrogenase E2 component (dihydrolipoamide succinyltransferase)|nr:dihydrolipoamide acetyltransferase family protein [Salinivirgaceae bacterium]